jgi:alpha-tubulin suppressor-like RCC1 family protein
MRMLSAAALAALLISSAAGARLSPRSVLPMIQATAVAVGGEHGCALTSAGGVKCWGDNEKGELGNGTTAGSSTPADVLGLTSGVSAISAGDFHTCALTSAGGVVCWGWNAGGQLGNGTTTDSSTPVAVSGLSSGVTAISGGAEHTCAVTSGGGVKCWGLNGNGQLGDGKSCGEMCPNPVDVSGLSAGVRTIAAGGSHTCALTNAGAVECWGYNLRGQVGDGTTDDRYAPVAVSGLGSGVAALDAGGNHSCAVTTAGEAKCWGWNLFGQVGDGQTCGSICPTPVDVSGLAAGVGAVSAGVLHSCALVLPGSVKCWGDNRLGMLGDGQSCGNICFTPVDVSGSKDYVVVSAGGGQTCGLTGPGAVRCWGSNQFGQLGDGTTTNSAVPVDVIGFGPPPVICLVPNVLGKLLAKAKARILKAHCRVGRITKKHSTSKKKGRVLAQSPKPGTKLEKGARVRLTVGKGRAGLVFVGVWK